MGTIKYMFSISIPQYIPRGIKDKRERGVSMDMEGRNACLGGPLHLGLACSACLLLSFCCLQCLEIPWREFDAMVKFKVIVVDPRPFPIIHQNLIIYPLDLVNHIRALIWGAQLWSDMPLTLTGLIPNQITNIIFFLMHLPVKEGFPVL